LPVFCGSRWLTAIGLSVRWAVGGQVLAFAILRQQITVSGPTEAHALRWDRSDPARRTTRPGSELTFSERKPP